MWPPSSVDHNVGECPSRDFGGFLIELSSAAVAPDPAVLRSPGGFTWFYVDLVDGQGRGATVIWSWGLPFLPGYARALFDALVP